MIIIDKEKMEVRGEQEDDVMNLLADSLRSSCLHFINNHPKTCKDYPAYKFAHLIDWHFQEIEKEIGI